MNAKLFSAAIFTLFITVAANAQLKKVPFFQMGIKGGANLTKVDGKSFNDEFKTGYHAGAFVQLRLSNKFQVQPEVLFNQFNTRTDTSFSNVYDIKNLKDVKLNYISIPLLLTYAPSKVISFQAGPQFGILIDKSKTIADNGKQAFRSGDLSMLGGVQVSIGGIRVNGRYFVGLNNINDIDNQEKWKNQGFQLSVGFKII
jgi:Outer membrane protein beta-barrel domain